MIKNSQEITKAHNAFIDIIHETLRNIYAQIYANYKENRKLAFKKIDQENERLKSNLLNCYKEDTFRHLLAKLFSRAGNLKTLEQNRLLVLPILTGKQDWQESRDIALIALSSYPATQKIELDSDDVIFFIFPLLIDEKLYTLAFLLL